MKREPAGTCIGTEGSVSFNIGPLWHSEQLTTPGVNENARPRCSDAVCPRWRCAAASELLERP